MAAGNPYDELPYRTLAVEWAAPERLALTSLVHGGPRPPLDRYRVLELGCGDGTNLLALAWYRRHATFVGVDGSARAIALAEARRAELGLANVELVGCDFSAAADRLDGDFDFILAHGVLSWIPDRARDDLLALVARRLRPGGLFYVNYNTRPGWNIRGMVRDFLRAQTAADAAADLHARTAAAQAIATDVAAALGAAGEHPYTQLLEREFQFVAGGHPSYVAHEFLAADNRAYWQSELLALAQRFGLAYVADADFNQASGRIPEGLGDRIAAAGLVGQPIEDVIDFLSYRQLHSPIFTRAPHAAGARGAAALAARFAELRVAACLDPASPPGSQPRLFRHPSGFEVEAKGPEIAAAFERLAPLWPRSLPVPALLSDRDPVVEDLALLFRHGLIELRLVEPADFPPPAAPLNEREREWTGHITTPHHTCRLAPA